MFTVPRVKISKDVLSCMSELDRQFMRGLESQITWEARKALFWEVICNLRGLLLLLILLPFYPIIYIILVIKGKVG